MPLYEYECPKCGRFEVMQKPSDRALKCNPDCKLKDCPKSAKKVISAAAFHFKGSGWYKTDYTKKPSSDKSAPASSGSGSTDSNEGKPPPKKKDGDASSSAPAAVPASKSSCGPGCGCH